MTYEEALERIEQLEEDKRQLMSRCYVHAQGVLCLFCCFKEECEHSTPKNKEEPRRKVRDRSNIFG